ncbi:MAG: hypothetical protein U1E73_09560 [Planctomycetota bacterium]
MKGKYASMRAGRCGRAGGVPPLVITRVTTSWCTCKWSAIVPTGHFSTSCRRRISASTSLRITMRTSRRRHGQVRGAPRRRKKLLRE